MGATGACSFARRQDDRFNRALSRAPGTGGSGGVPLWRRAPAVTVLGDAEALRHGRWGLVRLGSAQAETVEALPDHHPVGDAGDEAQAPAAAMVEVSGLTMVPEQRLLYAATHGRSAWSLKLP